jgi:hypothetical protein
MDDELYGQMLYGTLPPDTQDFQSVLRGIGRTLANQGRAAGQSVIEGGQRAEALQSQAFPDPTRPLQLQNPQALSQLTDMIMNGPMGMAQMGITAYHGSPYLFRMLDPARRGSGEGAQAYGSGAGYTAEARPVAEEYARNISRNKFIEEGRKKGQSAAYTTEASQLQQMVGDMPIQDYYTKLELQANRLPANQAKDAYAKLDIVERLGFGSNIPEIRQYAKEVEYPKSIQDWIEKELVPKYKPAGYLYKGDIPDEILPKFLDWDKPLKEQSKEVQALAKQYDLALDDLGGDLVAKVGKTPEGSAIMESAGLRGIKYFDANSRNAKYGSQNFVPFRAEDFKIQEINDMPIEQWYSKGLLDRPLTKVEQAYESWKANPNNDSLFQEYMKLRRLRDSGASE